MHAWAHIQKLFVLQWRNILVGMFVLIGSLVFFVVSWTQDVRLRRIFKTADNITNNRLWISYQTGSLNTREECREHVKGFMAEESAVLTALTLALVGPLKSPDLTFYKRNTDYAPTSRHYYIHPTFPMLHDFWMDCAS